LLIVNSNGELEVNGRSILLLYIADIKHGGLMNGHSFVHNVDIADIKPSETILCYRNPYPSIDPCNARLADLGEDRPISASCSTHFLSDRRNPDAFDLRDRCSQISIVTRAD